MEPDRLAKERELFLAARKLPQERWPAFLREHAQDDPALVDDVLALLRLDPGPDASATRYGPAGSASRPAALPDDPATAQLLARLSQRPRGNDRYTGAEEIGRGGMGQVLRVHDGDLGRDLAMKLALADGGPGRDASNQLLQRFLDEAQITGQLDHPGIVPVHELGLDADGRMYFTMRLIDGQTADNVFAKARAGRGGWTITRALDVILKVCDTMQFAHRKGVLHRDLKPSNVMVGQFGETYVVDWGLAKLVGHEDRRDLRVRQRADTRHAGGDAADPADRDDSPVRTIDGTVVGTPSFMSPEQASGRTELVDERADVYAIGSMLYHLLTGTQPYTTPDGSESPYAVLAALLARPPAPISEWNAQAPPELIAVCDKAMSRDRDQRYATAGELAEDLRAFLDRRVVAAYRTGALAELRKWIARNRAVAVALATTLVAILAGTFLASYWALKADEQELEAWRQAQAKARAEAGEQQAKQEAATAAGQRARAERGIRRELDAKRRVAEMIARTEQRRSTVELAARWEMVDQRLATLSGLIVGDVPNDRLEALLEPLARDLAPDDATTWYSWILDRWAYLRGDLATAGVDPQPIDETNAAPLASWPPSRLLRDAIRRHLAGSRLLAQGQLRAIGEHWLPALTELRVLKGALAIDREHPDRMGFERIGLRIARDVFRALADHRGEPWRLEAACTELEDWLRAETRDGQRTPEQLLLRAALQVAPTTREDLPAAAALLERLPEHAEVGDLLALVHRRSRSSDRAIEVLRNSAPTSATRATDYGIEEVASLMQQNRRLAALARLEQTWNAVPPMWRNAQPGRRCRAMMPAVRAACGDYAGALDALPADVPDEASLHRGHLHARLGQTTPAMAAYLGLRRNPLRTDVRELSARARPYFADVARRGLDVALATDAYSALVTSTDADSKFDIASILAIDGLRWIALDDEANARDAALRAFLGGKAKADPYLRLLGHQHLARQATLDGRTEDAIAQLLLASSAADRLLELGPCPDGSEPELRRWSLAELGEESIRILGSIARRGPPSELADFWQVLVRNADLGAAARCNVPGTTRAFRRLPEMQRRLARDQAWVSWVACTDRSFALVVTRTSIQCILLPPEDAIRAQLERLVDDETREPALAALGELLLQPICESAGWRGAKPRSLLVQTAGLMDRVPFAWCRVRADDGTHKAMIESYDVARSCVPRSPAKAPAGRAGRSRFALRVRGASPPGRTALGDRAAAAFFDRIPATPVHDVTTLDRAIAELDKTEVAVVTAAIRRPTPAMSAVGLDATTPGRDTMITARDLAATRCACHLVVIVDTSEPGADAAARAEIARGFLDAGAGRVVVLPADAPPTAATELARYVSPTRQSTDRAIRQASDALRRIATEGDARDAASIQVWIRMP